MNIRITVLVYILIACIFLYGYMQLRYLKSELEQSRVDLKHSQAEVIAIKADIDKLTEAQAKRQDNRIIYTTKVVEIQKEKSKESLDKIKQNPIEYQNKVNKDFIDLSSQFREVSK